VSGLPVVDADGHVVGVLSEADVIAKEVDRERRSGNALIRFLEGPPLDDGFDAVTVDEAMSSPAIVIRADRRVADAATLMQAEGINRLPFVDIEGRLVGIVTRADLVRAFTRDDETIREEIMRGVLEELWIDPSRVTVTVANGIATLHGELESEAEVRAVAALARRVPGVVDVTSTLHARP
jgi:CBS domain-containing protein